MEDSSVLHALVLLNSDSMYLNQTGISHLQSSPALEGYDLLAIRPGTDKILQVLGRGILV